MPRNSDVLCPAGVWTQLTNGDVTALMVHNPSSLSVLLKATAGTTAPVDTGGGIMLGPKETLTAATELAHLWPGVSGANRVWAYPGDPVSLGVSHA